MNARLEERMKFRSVLQCNQRFHYFSESLKFSLEITGKILPASNFSSKGTFTHVARIYATSNLLEQKKAFT